MDRNMNMKKSLIIFSLIFLLIQGNVFAQKSAESANRNTAIRCYKLAENCMVGKDWTNALSQAELGLSYDSTISDLVYIKAVSKIHLGETKHEVIKIVKEAFDKNNWISYSKTGARILYADLLSDTGDYENSLKVLDEDSFVFSADAEIIRIKNYYRIGTEESYNQARLKINSSRRVYSNDSRFALVFFNYELQRLILEENINGKYEIPELVSIIASSYLSKLPDYSNSNVELEILAPFFADVKLQKRLVASINAKENVNNPLFPLLALRAGVLNEQQALSKFLENSNNSILLPLLENLSLYIESEQVRENLVEVLNTFEGSVLLDINHDLQYELTVKYESGRPSEIVYDYNNDGLIDVSSECDFGAPVKVVYSDPSFIIEYEKFPEVKTVTIGDDNCIFTFAYGDFKFKPFEIIYDEILSSDSFKFYIPQISGEVQRIALSELIKYGISARLPISERENGTIEYSITDGQLNYAKFYEGDYQYAFCDFEQGLPFVRFVDYDKDEVFETFETYDVLKNEELINSNAFEDNDIIRNVFSKVADSQNIYLKEVQIDRNANTIFEYTEIFLGHDGRCCIWDYDDDGKMDIKYTKYPWVEGETLTEETVFYNKDGTETVKIIVEDSIPLRLYSDGNEVMIFAGKVNNVYWLQNKGSENTEKVIINKMQEELRQGAITLVEVDNSQYFIIKVFEDYFIREIKE